MILKIFTKPDCPNCPGAKELGKELEQDKNPDMSIEWYDVSEIDGLTEGTFYSVLSTPSLVLTANDGMEVKSWRGETPLKKEILAEIPEE